MIKIWISDVLWTCQEALLHDGNRKWCNACGVAAEGIACGQLLGSDITHPA